MIARIVGWMAMNFYIKRAKFAIKGVGTQVFGACSAGGVSSHLSSHLKTSNLQVHL